MSDYSNVGKSQKILTMWIIWFAIPMGLVIMHKFAAPKVEVEESDVITGISTIGIIGICFILAAAGIRWLVIPRLRNFQTGMVCMVVGLALSEFPGMLSMFVVRREALDERMLLFALAYGSALTFAPVYAKRLAEGPKPPPLS